MERLFPKDPDDIFVDDEARSIDRRLSSSKPKIEY